MWVINMIVRQNYLNKLINSKDTEFIKVIIGVRRSGKSTLLLMFKEYLIENKISEKNIIHINFESAIYDEIKDYKDLYEYIKIKLSKGKNYILLDEVQNEYEDYKDKLYKKTLKHINKMSKKELEESLVYILNILPDWIYEKFVREYVGFNVD